ncbi:putative HLH transcription factor (Hpa3) [Planoprotostelium fungivorum]|uniref:Putative HLH transcription factor (Hpa3) n=1 Tax=Planoprotostelium fungivorum TaxID=1890364 RepID=A0A2P6NZ87_9EUKA|nr:putative HLH transcription factor (Hpa3) [Planoprotostelium fungivorum]
MYFPEPHDTNDDSMGVKRKTNQINEQRGRKQISQQIEALKSLLPECNSVVTTKVFILECAVNNLRRLRDSVQQIENNVEALRKYNDSLRAQLRYMNQPPPSQQQQQQRESESENMYKQHQYHDNYF